MQAALVALSSETTLTADATAQAERKRGRDQKRASSSRAALRDDPVAHAEYCRRERERNDQRRGSSGKRRPRWTAGEEVRRYSLRSHDRSMIKPGPPLAGDVEEGCGRGGRLASPLMEERARLG